MFKGDNVIFHGGNKNRITVTVMKNTEENAKTRLFNRRIKQSVVLRNGKVKSLFPCH